MTASFRGGFCCTIQSMTYLTEDQEILDLVDKDDNVIGTIARRDTAKPGPHFGYIRASEAFLMNTKGQLWVPKRTLTKKISPGGYDFACAEHVGAGETYDEAIVRGFQEELNLNITIADLTPLGVLRPVGDINYFRAIYVYKSDKAPQYNPEDFTGYEWLTPEEVLRNIANGVPAKAVIPESIALLKQRM